MIHKLPPEVIELIIGHLYLILRPETTTHVTGSSGVVSPRYVAYGSWNKVACHPSLLGLAHACKYLQSIVYQIVFSSVACCAHETEGNDSPELYTSFSSDFLAESHISEVYISNFYSGYSPKFVMTIPHNSISREALHNVRSLFLGFSSTRSPNRPWLLDFLKKTISLQSVYLNVNSQSDHADIAYTIECLGKQIRSLQVHLHIGLVFRTQKKLSAFLRLFESTWASWKMLPLQSLIIEAGNELYKFPGSFLKTIQQLLSLESFELKSTSGITYHFDPKEAPEMYGISETPRFLQCLPNLKKLKLDFTEGQISRHCDWYPGVCVYALKITLGMFKPSHTFEMFDSITYLELQNENQVKGSIKCPFRNLRSLVLNNFNFNIQIILSHLVSANNDLIDLTLCNCKVDIPKERLLFLLANIQYLNLDETTCISFQNALTCAPNLRHFYFIPEEDGITKDYMPLEWLLSALKQNKISSHLRKIYLQVQAVLPENYNHGVEWAHEILAEVLPLKMVKEIVTLVEPFDNFQILHLDSLIIDLDLLSQLKKQH